MRYLFVFLVASTILSCSRTTTSRNGNPPLILSVDTVVAKEGDVLNISGQNFSSNPVDNLVSIGNALLTVEQATTQRLQVRITPAARGGTLSVFVKGYPVVSYLINIQIIREGQPVIRKVLPSVDLEPGDTIKVIGLNFKSIGRQNAVTLAGTTLTVLDANDTLLTAVTSSLVKTGGLTVTSGGIASLPFPVQVTQVDPLEDGRISWILPKKGTTLNNEKYLTGKDRDEPSGSGNIVHDFADMLGTKNLTNTLNGIDGLRIISFSESQKTNSLATISNPEIVEDAAGNFYRLSAAGSTYSLNRFVASNNYAKQVIWSYTRNSSNRDVFQPEISLDGNFLYLINNSGSTYLRGDITQSNPTFQRNSFGGDILSFSLAFSRNKRYSIQYQPLNSNSNRYSGTGGIMSADRSAAGGTSIPLPLTLSEDEWSIANVIAGADHGDSLLILADRRLNTLTRSAAILLFDPVTATTKVLYDRSNWRDADHPNIWNSNLLWAGSHIYYAKVTTKGSTALYRLNSSGLSVKPASIYARLEDVTLLNQNKDAYFFLFINPRP